MAQIYRRSPIMVKQTNETTPMERPGALYRSCRGHICVGATHAVWCQDIPYTVCQHILYTLVLTDSADESSSLPSP